MHKHDNPRAQGLSKYDALPTEELSQILRLDSEAPEGNEIDMDTLLYITGVLAERKKINQKTEKTVQDSWNAFQQNYMPSEEKIQESKEKKKCNHRVRRWIAAAAVVALFVFVPLTAKAVKWEELWNVVVVRSNETFSLVRDDKPSAGALDSPQIQQNDTMIQTLQQYNMDPNSAPTWIPDGFVLKKLDVSELPGQTGIIALYERGEQYLTIQLKTYLDCSPEHTEISGDFVEIYTVAGVDYYIYENNGWMSAAWLQGDIQGLLSGEITVDEVKKIIDSIPKG